jgi:hypothetical protein
MSLFATYDRTPLTLCHSGIDPDVDHQILKAPPIEIQNLQTPTTLDLVVKPIYGVRAGVRKRLAIPMGRRYSAVK